MDQRFVAAAALAALVTLVTILTLRRLAPRVGLVDRPSERKRHRGRVPLVGGLSFFLGTIVGLAYYGPPDGFSTVLLAASALVFLTGLIDDLDGSGVGTRLLVQAAATCLVILASGVHVDTLGPLFGSEWRLHWLGIPFTVLAVVGLVNAFNMLDGIDGLAGGMALVGVLFVLVFAGAAWPAPGVALVLQLLSIALVPYLLVNLGWPDGRKIFMGDAGSTFIGFLVAWGLVQLSQAGTSPLRPVDVLWCVAVPVMDTAAVTARRLRMGCSPFACDRRHLHHRLLDAGWSARESLVIIIGAGVAFGLAGYALRAAPDAASLALFVATLVAYAWWQPNLLRQLRAPRGPVQAVPPGTGAAAVAIPGGAPPTPHAAADPGVGRITDGAIPIAGIRARAAGARVRTLVVLGPSPDDIVVAPVLRQLARDDRFEAKTCVAAHAPGLAQVLQQLDIPVDLELDIDCLAGDDAGGVDASLLARMKQLVQRVHPDVVLVHGESPPALATAMAAAYERVPLVHMASWMPEAGAAGQAGRDLIAALAALHLASTATAWRRLLAAGIPEARVVRIHDAAPVALAAAMHVVTHDPRIRAALAQRFAFMRAGSPLLLAMDRACEDAHPGLLARGLRALAARRLELDIVHVASAHRAAPALRGTPGILRIDRLDCLELAFLLDACRVVLTDSGEMRSLAVRLDRPAILVRNAPRRGSDGDGVRWIAGTEHTIAECVDALLVDRHACGALADAGTHAQAGIDADAHAFQAIADLPLHAASLAA